MFLRWREAPNRAPAHTHAARLRLRRALQPDVMDIIRVLSSDQASMVFEVLTRGYDFFKKHYDAVKELKDSVKDVRNRIDAVWPSIEYLKAVYPDKLPDELFPCVQRLCMCLEECEAALTSAMPQQSFKAEAARKYHSPSLVNAIEKQCKKMDTIKIDLLLGITTETLKNQLNVSADNSQPAAPVPLANPGPLPQNVLCCIRNVRSGFQDALIMSNYNMPAYATSFYPLLLCSELHHLPSLRVLSLASVDIGAEGLRLLATKDVLGGMKQLAELDLSGNSICSTGAFALATSDAMDVLAGSLRKLVVNMCDIGNEGIIALAGANFMPRLAALHSIDLSNNSITLQGAEALVKTGMLGGLSRLRYLALGNNPPSGTGREPCDACRNSIGDAGIALLTTQSVLGCMTQLEHLDVSGNNLSEASAAALAKPLVMTALQALTTLDLHDNPGLGSTGVAGLAGWPWRWPLAPSLATMPGLVKLDLRNTGLTEASVESLDRALSDLDVSKAPEVKTIAPLLPSLRDLDLSKNPDLSIIAACTLLSFAVAGNLPKAKGSLLEKTTGLSQPLRNVVQKLPTLPTDRLNLNDAGVGFAGAWTLVRLNAFINLPKLKHLFLANNRIGDRGILYALGKNAGLPSLRSLETLDLGGNDLSHQSVAKLAEALGKLRNLELLILRDNQLERDSVRRLVRPDSLGGLDKLTQLYLQGNRTARVLRDKPKSLVGKDYHSEMEKALPRGTIYW